MIYQQSAYIGEAGSSLHRGHLQFEGVASREAGTNPLNQWTQTYYQESGPVNAVAYGNGIFVAVGGIVDTSGYTSLPPMIVTSPDGSTWTQRPVPIPTGELNGVTYGNGMFVAVGYGPGYTPIILTSPDGATWTESTSSVEKGQASGGHLRKRYIRGGWRLWLYDSHLSRRCDVDTENIASHYRIQRCHLW